MNRNISHSALFSMVVVVAGWWLVSVGHAKVDNGPSISEALFSDGDFRKVCDKNPEVWCDEDDDCPGVDEKCGIVESIVMASRNRCAYAVNAREPYCKVSDGSGGMRFEPVGWDVCGKNEYHKSTWDPRAKDDCSDYMVCENAANTLCRDSRDCPNHGNCIDKSYVEDLDCYYCQVPSDGEVTGAHCLPSLCENESAEGDAKLKYREPAQCSFGAGFENAGTCSGELGEGEEPRRCVVGDRHDCPDLEECVALPVGFERGRCGGAPDAEACFRPAEQRVDWAFATKSTIVNDPEKVDCTVDPEVYEKGREGLAGTGRTFVSQPTPRECVYIGSDGHSVYALHADSPDVHGSCLWEQDVQAQCQAQVTPVRRPSGETVLYAGTDAGRVWALRPYPAMKDASGCNGNPLACPLTNVARRVCSLRDGQLALDQEVDSRTWCDSYADCYPAYECKEEDGYAVDRFHVGDLALRFDPIVPRDANGDDRDRILFGANEGGLYLLATEFVGDPGEGGDAQPPGALDQFPEEVRELAMFRETPFRFGGIQAGFSPSETAAWSQGRIYAAFGASSGDSGLVGLDLREGALQFKNGEEDDISIANAPDAVLDPIWAVYNNKKRKLSETEGNRYPDTRWLRADIIEYHRGYPVLSTDDRTLFMSNRKTRDKAFGRRLAAFAVDRDCPRKDGTCVGGDITITTNQLRWSHRGEAGMVAAPGLGLTRCTDDTCCTVGEPVDTVFIGDKNKNFTALEHCASGEPHKKWGDDADRFQRAKVRSTPLVVERDIENDVAGTAFVGNEDDGSSRGYFYAVNAETGKVRWLHYLGNDNKDDDNGSNFACAAAAAPATQTGCHPPPLVYASVGSGELNNPVDPELRCVPAGTPTLALEIKALLHPDADAVSGVRVREEGVEGWMEEACVSVPCAVDLPGPFDVAREYTIEVTEGGKAGYATVALAPCA